MKGGSFSRRKELKVRSPTGSGSRSFVLPTLGKLGEKLRKLVEDAIEHGLIDEIVVGTVLVGHLVLFLNAVEKRSEGAVLESENDVAVSNGQDVIALRILQRAVDKHAQHGSVHRREVNDDKKRIHRLPCDFRMR